VLRALSAQLQRALKSDLCLRSLSSRSYRVEKKTKNNWKTPLTILVPKSAPRHSRANKVRVLWFAIVHQSRGVLRASPSRPARHRLTSTAVARGGAKAFFANRTSRALCGPGLRRRGARRVLTGRRKRYSRRAAKMTCRLADAALGAAALTVALGS